MSSHRSGCGAKPPKDRYGDFEPRSVVDELEGTPIGVAAGVDYEGERASYLVPGSPREDRKPAPVFFEQENPPPQKHASTTSPMDDLN